METMLKLLPLADWNHDGDPGWIFGLVFWLALLAVVLLVMRGRGWFGPGGPGDGRREQREGAVELLERRFATGELSVEEYRQRRTVLEERRE